MDEPIAFPIPLARIADPDPNFFLLPEPDRALNRKEQAWLKQQVATPGQPLPAAPSAPALRALAKSMEDYRGNMPVTKEEWQNYCLERYFELSRNPDVKVAKSALDSLARSNKVGLLTDEQTVNINTKTTLELESELAQKIASLLQKTKTNTERVIDAEYAEL